MFLSLYRYFRFIVLLLGYCTLTISCSELVTKRPIVMPSGTQLPEFEFAIRGLTNDLLRQVENKQRESLEDKNISEHELPKISIVLRSFSEATNGYTVTLSKGQESSDTNSLGKKKIIPIGKNNEELIYAEANERETCQNEYCTEGKEECQKNAIIFSLSPEECEKDTTPIKRFGNISIVPLSRESLKQADYIMYGVFRLEPAPISTGETIEKRYHTYVVIVDEKKQPPENMVAKADTWITDKIMHILPTKEGEESPIYLKDTGLEGLISNVTTGKAPPSSSHIDAMIADASKIYSTGDVDNALKLYEEIEQSRGGPQLKVYSALYQMYYQKAKKEETEVWITKRKKALDQMIALGVAEMKLEFKFLFKVNSVEFGTKRPGEQESIETLKWTEQYPLWIKAIGEYFSKSNECVGIIGHASNTASDEYDRSLSHRRATRISGLIKEQFPDVKTKILSIVGNGHDDCLLSEPKGVCLGTDDEQDAYDRRVEFKVDDCPINGN